MQHTDDVDGPTSTDHAPWWQSPSLRAEPAGLTLDGVDLVALARAQGTPLFVFSAATIRRQLAGLDQALRGAGVTPRIQYAMKANRSPGVLAAVRIVPGVGLDTCSPGEVDLALKSGFSPEEVSFNAGMLSDSDLDRVAAAGVPCILDSFSSLRRYGARVPAGTGVGLRFDPQVQVGYRARQHLAYGGAKFGFEPGALPDALAAARAAGLQVQGLHVHLGWGLGQDAAPAVDEAYARLAGLARQVPDLRWVNVGGGLGARFCEQDQPLSLERWAQAVERHLAPLGLPVACEPGTVVAAPAGVLLVTVNTVERRRGLTWVGVDAGHPLNPCPALYGIPITVVAAERPLAPPVGRVAVVGHINEAGDVWDARAALPEPHEGEVLALLPTGAYTTSMASRHCLRGEHGEVVVGQGPLGAQSPSR